MRRLIFLDIDGVLNSEEFMRYRWRRGDLQLDRRAISRLNRLVQESGAGIVISSWWRMRYSIPELQHILHEYGMDSDIRLAGFTPLLPDVVQEKASGIIRVPASRGAEIQQWLDVAAGSPQFPVRPEGIVILDDNDDMEHLRPRLVHVNARVGLMDSDIRTALWILTRQGDEGGESQSHLS